MTILVYEPAVNAELSGIDDDIGGLTGSEVVCGMATRILSHLFERVTDPGPCTEEEMQAPLGDIGATSIIIWQMSRS